METFRDKMGSRKSLEARNGKTITRSKARTTRVVLQALEEKEKTKSQKSV